MYITYDPERNLGYIRLKDVQGTVAETLCISSELNIDLAPDGSIYGIELLNANEQLKGHEAGIVVENQHSHQRQKLRL